MPISEDVRALATLIGGQFRDGLVQGLDELGQRLLLGINREIGAMGTPAEYEAPQAFSSAGVNGFVDIPAGVGTGTVNATVKINDEADFIANRMTFIAWTAATGALVASPSFLFQWQTGGGDLQLQNFPLHIQGIAGNGQQCIPFRKSMMFRRASTVNASFTNLTATAMRAQVILWGNKRKLQGEGSVDIYTRR